MIWNSIHLASSLARQRLGSVASSFSLSHQLLHLQQGATTSMTTRIMMIPELTTTAVFEDGTMIQKQHHHQQQQQQYDDNDDETTSNNWIWFAVPKRKHTRSRKRMKTTSQKRIPLKKNIVFDPRTGEVTLKHKLPFNWKDYLPKVE